MLVIRLQRIGRTNDPSFRIVLADKRRSAKGKFLEILGHYLPARNPAVLEFDAEKVSAWVAKGAQPSDTLARLLTRAGVKGLAPFIQRYAKRRSKKAPPEELAAAPAAAAPAAPEAAAPSEGDKAAQAS